MRTLILEINEDGTVGGSHRALYDLVTALDRSRYQPIVLFYQSNEFVGRLRDRGVEVIAYDEVRELERRRRRERGRIGRALETAVSLKRRYDLLRSHRIELVHMINSPWPGCDDWFPAAKLRGIPFVASAMGVPPPEMDSKPVQAWLVRRVERILPVSQLIADLWGNAGVRRGRMQVVHHGVDVPGIAARVRRRAPDVRRDLEVLGDRLLVAMVGNVREWKGQHVVVEALHLLHPVMRDRLFVVFAGAESERDISYRQRLDRMVAEYGLKPQVHFLGFRNDVPDIMAAADIIVHASVQPEPGGIVVLEAMALGAAIIAGARGGHTEVMVEGTGLTFNTERPDELAACLTRLASDDELRIRLGRAATERVRQFSIERNARETEQVYDNLLAD